MPIHIDEEILDLFKSETNENLERAEKIIFKFEETNEINREELESILRAFHSIKGSALTINKEKIATLSHKLESIINLIIKGKLNIDKELISFILESNDTIRLLLEKEDINIDNILKKLDEKISYSNNNKSKIILTNGKEIFHRSNSLRVKKKDMEKINEELNNLYLKLKNYVNFYEDINSYIAEIVNINNDFPYFEIKNKLLELDYINKIVINSFNFLKKRIDSLSLSDINHLIFIAKKTVKEVSYKTGKEVNITFEDNDVRINRDFIENLIDPIIHLIRNAIDHGIEDKEERIKKGKSETGNIKISFKIEGNVIHIDFSDDGRGIDIDSIKDIIKDNYPEFKDKINSLSKDEIINFIFKPGFSTSKKSTQISGRGIGMNIIYRNIQKLGGYLYIDTQKDMGTTFNIRIPLETSIINAIVFKVNNCLFGIPVYNLFSLLDKTDVSIEVENKKEFIVFVYKEYEEFELDEMSKKDTIYSNIGNFAKFFNYRVPYLDLSKILCLDSRNSINYYIVTQYKEKLLGLGINNIIGGKELLVKNEDNPFVSNEIARVIAVTENNEPVYIIDMDKLYNLYYFSE